MKNNEQMMDIINKLNDSRKNQIIFLSLLVVSALVIRLYNFPLDVPFFGDAQGYFWYAIDTSVLNQFPTGHNVTNNGWPLFVSIFFHMIDSNNFLDYQNIQRFIGVIFSVLTIFPVYLLCTRFFKKSYSLLGTTLFIFEPRLIQNSSNGTPESMYIFLIATLLYLFLSNNFKKIYLSFLIIGIISVVRYEGLLIIIPISIVFFIRFRSRKNDILKYFICAIILCSIILPVAYLKNETMGQDGFVSHISAGPNYYQASIKENNSALENFVTNGIINISKYLGWIQIPYFLFFVPLGILLFLKNIEYKKITIILTVCVILIPAFYAYSRDFSETKYLYALFPIFAILSCPIFKIIFDKTDKKKLIFCLILTGIILSSMIFIVWKSIDYEHYRETYQILTEISDKNMIVNSDFGVYGGEFVYFHWTRLHGIEEFPIKKDQVPELTLSYAKQLPERERTMKLDRTSEPIWKDKNQINDFEEYLTLLKVQNVSHLLIDEKNNTILINDKLRSDLIHVFNNEEKYPFLTKEYDSKENGFKYHIKLFKINYLE